MTPAEREQRLDPRRAGQAAATAVPARPSGVPPSPRLRWISEAPLLAMALAQGRASAKAVERITRLLHEMGGLSALLGKDAAALRRQGLERGEALAVLALVEIADRLAASRLPVRISCRRPREVARHLALRYGRAPQEILGVAWLDGRQRLLGERRLCGGAVDHRAVDLLPIFQEAELRAASAIVLFQVRPTGDLGPSAADLELGRRLLEDCEHAGLDLVDHLIVGADPDTWVSLREWW